jgi:mannan endo-1,4-beta-mannosidase
VLLLAFLLSSLPLTALAQSEEPAPLPDGAKFLFLPNLSQSDADAAAVTTQDAAAAATGKEFVKQAAGQFRLNGKIFRFAGTNNYYLMYKSKKMVDDVLEKAAANDFRVIRMWGSFEIGNEDGSNSVHHKEDGVYFTHFNGAAPVYNVGEDGLQRLDYALFKANQLGLKVIIPFVNNWNAFGGMDQYVRWRTVQDPTFVPYHDRFYTDPLIRRWYKMWIATLLTRTNIYTGVKYKDDPTIMAWELANEPRCLSAGVYGRSPDCTEKTITAWADEMSRFIKSIDNKHLVSAGDEGFYCIPGATDWTENCGEGVDTIALASLPKIDMMSLHLYPDHWGKDYAWGTQWIVRHIQDGKRINKPVVLGEFGVIDKTVRNAVYKEWTDAVFDNGGAGALYWILSGIQDDGTLYADYDGFTVYAGTPVFQMLGNFARSMNANAAQLFPPVADDDAAVTEFETPLTIAALANDVAYGGAALVPGSMDLDPAAAGQQTSVTVAAGTFAWQPDGSVLFTPAAGFSGKAQAAYTVADSAGRTSNVAALTVTVKPSPTAPIVLFSFETGTEGWVPGNWQANAGTVAQSTSNATAGSHSLQVTTAAGGWFVAPLGGIDLSSKSKIKLDLTTTTAGTSTSMAVQLGDGWVWCQTAWGWVNGGTSTTVEFDLNALGCADPQLTKFQAINIWFSPNGVSYIDNVRAE